MVVGGEVVRAECVVKEARQSLNGWTEVVDLTPTVDRDRLNWSNFSILGEISEIVILRVVGERRIVAIQGYHNITNFVV